MMRTTLRSVPAALLVLLFIYAAFSKLISFSDFRAELSRQPFAPADALILQYALPSAEILTALLLSFPRTLFAGLLLSLGLLVAFTLYVSLGLLHFFPHVPCPCGGILGHLGWTAHLFFNGAFICLNLIALFFHLEERRPVT